VKRKYDPEGLFFVHHGVRSDEWSADGFERLAQFDAERASHGSGAVMAFGWRGPSRAETAV
jgi:hypothetical protein